MASTAAEGKTGSRELWRALLRLTHLTSCWGGRVVYRQHPLTQSDAGTRHNWFHNCCWLFVLPTNLCLHVFCSVYCTMSCFGISTGSITLGFAHKSFTSIYKHKIIFSLKRLNKPMQDITVLKITTYAFVHSCLILQYIGRITSRPCLHFLFAQKRQKKRKKQKVKQPNDEMTKNNITIKIIITTNIKKYKNYQKSL